MGLFGNEKARIKTQRKDAPIAQNKDVQKIYDKIDELDAEFAELLDDDKRYQVQLVNEEECMPSAQEKGNVENEGQEAIKAKEANIQSWWEKRKESPWRMVNSQKLEPGMVIQYDGKSPRKKVILWIWRSMI